MILKRGMDVRDTKFVYFQICLREAEERSLKEGILTVSGGIGCEEMEKRGGESESEEPLLEEIEKRELIYDYKTCVGCGICVDICPTNALELGPVTEIAAGLDAPPVIMDVDKCPFCGMCVSFCPYNAFEMLISGKYIARHLTLAEKALSCEENERNEANEANKASEAGEVSEASEANEEDEVSEERETAGNVRNAEERVQSSGSCGNGESGEDETLSVNFIELECEYPRLNPSIKVDEERCLPCMLCERVCPMEAIEVEWSLPRKEEIAPFDETRSGEIKIDMEKCSLCGICTKFCDAFIIVEREFSAKEPIPFADIIIDENACDYCGLCEVLCPEDAIKVRVVGESESGGNGECGECGECGEAEEDAHRSGKVALTEEIIERLRAGGGRIGRLKVDDEKCKKCGWCEFVCPYDAISVEKPFDGEILLRNIEKCDPSGCRICRDVCPFNAWFVVAEGAEEEKEAKEAESVEESVEGNVEEKMKKGMETDNSEAEKVCKRLRVAVEEAVCIFCGACEKACPEDVIEVIRKSVRTTPVPDALPWQKQWSDAISRLLKKPSK